MNSVLAAIDTTTLESAISGTVTTGEGIAVVGFGVLALLITIKVIKKAVNRAT